MHNIITQHNWGLEYPWGVQWRLRKTVGWTPTPLTTLTLDGMFYDVYCNLKLLLFSGESCCQLLIFFQSKRDDSSSKLRLRLRRRCRRNSSSSSSNPIPHTRISTHPMLRLRHLQWPNSHPFRRILRTLWYRFHFRKLYRTKMLQDLHITMHPLELSMMKPCLFAIIQTHLQQLPVSMVSRLIQCAEFCVNVTKTILLSIFFVVLVLDLKFFVSVCECRNWLQNACSLWQ